MRSMNRCFITGQSCTHKRQIALKRKENHEKGIVSVFVVMAFTNMGFSLFDIIKDGVEQEIKKCFGFNSSKEPELRDSKKKNEPLEPVKQVCFERADFSVSTGHVICNRVCDLIQVADIVMIDVSRPNPNVFYELGMAMSMGKDILPVCFTKIYYYKSKIEIEYDNQIKYFPKIKELYEYFSLYCHANGTPKAYGPYKDSVEEKKNSGYKFDDENEKLCVGEFMYRLLADGITKNNDEGSKKNTLMLYSEKGIEVSKTEHDKLAKFSEIIENVRKITEAVSNPQLFHGDQALILAQDNKLYEKDIDNDKGKLIGYNVADITKDGVQKAIEKAQENSVFSRPRFEEKPEGEEHKHHSQAFIAYGRSPIFMERIRSASHRELRLFTDVVLKQANNENNNDDDNNASNGNVYLSVKEEYKKYPEWNTPFYTYLNVMVTYMRYANQVLIDTYANDIVAYFWLGVCHAAGVDTVRIERTFTDDDKQNEEERKERARQRGGEAVFTDTEDEYYKTIRSVFDVAGLWCAYVNARNIQDYLLQLEKVEVGILEHHYAYVDGKVGEIEINEYLKRRSREPSLAENIEKALEWPKTDDNHKIEGCLENIKGKIEEIRSALNQYHENEELISEYNNKKDVLQERYYRHVFWQAMGRGVVKFYQGIDRTDTHQIKDKADANQVENGELSNAKWHVGVWDQKTTGLLTQQMLMYQKAVPLSIEVVERQSREKTGETAGKQADVVSAIYVGDNRVNAKCREFLSELPKPKPDYIQLVGNIGKDAEKNAKTDECASHRKINSICMDESWFQPTEKCFKCEKKGENCPHQFQNSFDSYGGLFLQRKDGMNNVYIIGGSGVTTYAMASIFVDADLRYSGLFMDGHSDENGDKMLSLLQADIRSTYISKCLEKIRGESETETSSTTRVTLSGILKEDGVKKMLSGDDQEKKMKLNAQGTDLENWKAIQAYVDRLFSRYFIPFVTNDEMHGMRKSLEFYLQSYFERNVREKKETNPTKLWDNYESFNKVMDSIVDCIVDGFIGPLEKDIIFEAILRVTVTQKLDKEEENYIKSITGFKVGLEKVGMHDIGEMTTDAKGSADAS